MERHINRVSWQLSSRQLKRVNLDFLVPGCKWQFQLLCLDDHIVVLMMVLFTGAVNVIVHNPLVNLFLIWIQTDLDWFIHNWIVACMAAVKSSITWCSSPYWYWLIQNMKCIKTDICNSDPVCISTYCCSSLSTDCVGYSVLWLQFG